MTMIPQDISKYLSAMQDSFHSGPALGFGEKLSQIREYSDQLALLLLREWMKETDKTLAQDPGRKEDWDIVRKDERELLTCFGLLRFERYYYRNKKTGEYAYLLDRYLGIDPYQKVSGEVKQQAVEAAVQASYSKSGKAACPEGISRMSVCNYVGELKHFPQMMPEGERRCVDYVYVEADEDHVALRSGRNAQVKLVYAHEGVREKGGRQELVNPRYMTWPLEKASDDLWEEVSTHLEQTYDSALLKGVFLSGDAAPWIRAGEEWLYPCIPILDGFHVKKALRQLFGGRDALVSAFWRYVREDKYQEAQALCRRVLEESPESKRAGKARLANYLLGNWTRIRNRQAPGAQGCSAEGHVSHILSERLSSRPRGWSEKNLNNMAQMRVMLANGQAISYAQLAGKGRHAQKSGHETAADTLIQDKKLNAKLKRNAKNTLKETMYNLPVMNCGTKSQLYQTLKEISAGELPC